MMDLLPDINLEELLSLGDDQDPRCELFYSCPTHGEEPCENRARWVAKGVCQGCGQVESTLACDVCHDTVVAKRNRLPGVRGTVEWRPL